MATDFNTEPDIPLSQIPGYSDIAEIVTGLPLNHFSIVDTFLFRRREESQGQASFDIYLVMREREQPYRKIGFRFHDSREIQCSGWISIIGLFFQCIKDRGWETLRYEVGDYESNEIHLYCRTISVFNPNRTDGWPLPEASPQSI